MLIALLLFNQTLKSQVTIGSQYAPNGNSLLDLRQNSDSSSTKGLLLPRVSLANTTSKIPLSAHEKGMLVYNTNDNPAGINGADGVTPGVYYNDGSQWVKVNEPQWFYMPSFDLPITLPPGTETTVDLYAEYFRQFTKGVNNTQFVSSNTAETQMGILYTADELEYYVTAYTGGAIQIISISPTGVMDYKVLSNDVPAGSYINVIFKVK